MSDKPTFDTYALVELFGHQKIVGRVTEANIAGGAFIRVDVAAFEGQPAFTRYFGPGAIYSINPIEEQLAAILMQQYRNAPVEKYDIPEVHRRKLLSHDDREEGA